MAGKSKPKDSVRGKVEYIALDLTKANRADLVKWLESNPDLWDLIEKSCDSGLKFSVSHDDFHDCIQATLTKVPDDRVFGTTTVLIGRGPDMLKAIQALFFKHHIVLQETWDNPELRNPRGVTDWS